MYIQKKKLYTYIYLHIYTHIYIYLHIYVYLSVYLSICLSIYLSICHLSINLHICKYIYIYIHIYVCVCTYIYIYIHTHKHTHSHIHPHTNQNIPTSFAEIGPENMTDRVRYHIQAVRTPLPPERTTLRANGKFVLNCIAYWYVNLRAPPID